MDHAGTISTSMLYRPTKPSSKSSVQPTSNLKTARQKPRTSTVRKRRMKNRLTLLNVWPAGGKRFLKGFYPTKRCGNPKILRIFYWRRYTMRPSLNGLSGGLCMTGSVWSIFQLLLRMAMTIWDRLSSWAGWFERERMWWIGSLANRCVSWNFHQWILWMCASKGNLGVCCYQMEGRGT